MALQEAINDLVSEMSPEDAAEFNALLAEIEDTSVFDAQAESIRADGKRQLETMYAETAEEINSAFQREANEITKLFN